MTPEADDRSMWPQTKEHAEPPEAGRQDEGSSPTAFRGSTTDTQTSDFEAPERCGNKLLSS